MTKRGFRIAEIWLKLIGSRVPKLQPSCELTIKNFKVLVKIGVEATERLHPQIILFTISLRYYTANKAGRSDDIKDALCYDDICHQITNLCNSKEFALVEHLGWFIYNGLKNLYKDIDVLKVTVHKKPLIQNLEQGVFFTVSDPF